MILYKISLSMSLVLRYFLNFPLCIITIDRRTCPRLFLCVQRVRDDDVTWMLDRVGERALIRLFCLGVHSPAHYQAYCPSHCYPYPDDSLFCNFPHLTDTTTSLSTPIPRIFLPICTLLLPRPTRIFVSNYLFSIFPH